MIGAVFLVVFAVYHLDAHFVHLPMLTIFKDYQVYVISNAYLM